MRLEGPVLDLDRPSVVTTTLSPMTTTCPILTDTTVTTSTSPTSTTVHILNDDIGSKRTATQSRTSNGVVRNTSFPTLSSSGLPSSSSSSSLTQGKPKTPSPKKSVSTLFSSNHTKSWQCSLSNYSQDSNRHISSAGGSAEALEMQTRRSSFLDLAKQVSPTKQSKVFVYQDSEPTMVSTSRSFVDLKSACQQHSSASATCQSCAQSRDMSQGDSQSNEKGLHFADQPNCSSNQRAHPHVSVSSSHVIMHENPVTVISVADHKVSRRPPERSFSERKPRPPDGTPQRTHSRHASYTPDVQPDCNVQSQTQSVCLRTHGNAQRADPNHSYRHSYSEQTEHERRGQEKHRRHSRHHAQTKVSTGDSPNTQLTFSSSDCPSDTQPLLPHPGMRRDGGVTGSPEQQRMCVDNAMVRFQTVDYREPTAGNRKERAGFERAQTVPIGSRIEVTSNSISENIHLGVLGFGSSSSPTGSDTLAAPPLNELYRYHVFFSHCPQDVGWVQEVVARLEAPPYNYRCAASPDSPQDAASLEQNLLCAAMLSERVVLVLSKQYVQETWFTFEKVLRQLTQMSLHNQRIMGVLLEDCDIPETLGELYFLDTSDPDFFHVFSKRLKTGRIPRSSESVSSDLAARASIAPPPSVTNGQTIAQCTLAVKVGWDSFLDVVDTAEDLPPTLKAQGINLERPEFYAIVHNVSTVLNGSNKLPWVLCVQPLVALLMAGALWLPAFIAVLAVQVDDNSGMALPVRLIVFIFPLGIVSCGYLLKWRRRYWLSKIIRLLVQNCVKANQLLYCEGRPILTTAGHVKANNFAVYFIYFDMTDCVRSVDLLLFTCLEDDWDKLMRLVEFYARDKAYLSQVSMSERLTVMMAAAYLFKLIRGVLPHPPQQRHMTGQLCLCQFTEECVTRFVHSLDREDIPALSDLFTRHLFGHVSGSAVHRITTDLFHRLG